MTADVGSAVDTAPSPAERLIDALPQLLDSLRRADFDVGTEQYLAACDLILDLSLQHATIPGAQLRPSLAGLFCTRAEEQTGFPELFDPWYGRLNLERAAQPTSPPPEPPPEPTWLGLSRKELLRLRWLALVLALMLGNGLGYWLWPSTAEPARVAPQPVPLQVEEQKPKEPTTPRLQLIPPPQTPAEPVIPPRIYFPVWTEPVQQAWLLPVTLWSFWFLSKLLLRHQTLARRKKRPGEEITLKDLQLASDHTALLAGPALAETWRQLRSYRSHPMRRIDEAASVARTLAQGGYFRPVYRDRQVPPAYIVMNDRRHAQDHAAAMVEELVSSMRRENLEVALFNYDTDPDYAVRAGEVGLERSSGLLAAIYSDYDLLLAGDGETLFEIDTGQQHHKLDVFAPFQRRLMLTLDPVWAQGPRRQVYAEADFQLLPLTTQGLSQLGRRDTTSSGDHPADLPLPRLLAIDPKRWLGERHPGKKQLNRLLTQLEEYLGVEGLLLFSATAAYPELNWQLTRALDLQLKLEAGEQQLRLRRLSRLPWFRYGRIPDYLRKALLRHLDASRFKRVTGAFEALLEHRGDQPLKLPYAVPEWRGFAAYWKDLRALSARHTALADRVFASVVRGRRPRLLEFSLPDLERGLIGKDWRGLLWPLLAGLLLGPAAVWLNLWGWQTWLEPSVRQSALVVMQASHQAVTVSVVAPEALSQHGEALTSSLRAWGFEVLPLTSLQEITKQSKQQSVEQPSVEQKSWLLYAPQAQPVVQAIADRLAYLYFGEQPELQQAEPGNLSADIDVQIRLQSSPKVFRDPFISPVKPIEPEMVTIEPGRFMMGSNKKDNYAYEQEFPAHSVEISRPFAIGRYEVTFDEYDRFVEATGLESPDDEGWGRGQRPVINVSWEDARSYAEWLSKQTGKTYRLPTEAEWEYVTRAGSVTAYWWGEDINHEKQVWANCDGCGSEWDNKQTAPVGSFFANPFGVQDTAGNVWEWVEDCWHGDYQDAPVDGSAWLEAEGGDCDQRVVRGGSWSYNPWWLRSAYRVRLPPSYRGDFLGFRLVQDLLQ